MVLKVLVLTLTVFTAVTMASARNNDNSRERELAMLINQEQVGAVQGPGPRSQATQPPPRYHPRYQRPTLQEQDEAGIPARYRPRFPPTLPPGLITSQSCTQYCESGGYGSGVVIGTAPSCDAHCGSDCYGRECTTWPDDCWTGHKICCCAK